MLRVLRADVRKFEQAPEDLSGWLLPQDAVWIDLDTPTRDEEVLVENQLGVLLPTREEMAEIEASSRLYQEDGATIMTASILYGSETQTPTTEPITFALVAGKLVTIRYVEPHSFKIFAGQVEKHAMTCASGGAVFLSLLEAIVDRTADILERTGTEVEGLSRDVFARPRTRRFEDILAGLGHAQTVGAKVRESLVSLSRLVGYASLAAELTEAPDARERLKTLTRDGQSLTDHASYVAGNVTFLLDAALGLINIEQNAIIKIFSVAAVVFMPPTLIASIYGMNFHHMPELDWRFAYPAAICAMVVSAILPLLWFQKKGWL
jgi:magnesium transporter